ncbi:T9SS type A sorting domain-containing protein [Brumimicrobium oceani]|uniref:T9SS type A sorting domain-containing protein n=1 Tax=Brumimicrobium oceani TaxID=2100725 RepID=UPI001304D5DA|nr:T9SS type A sorting domain-containing protein [Brumimicrobium oceani]
MQIKLIPNPNSGNFIFEINQANPKGSLYVYGVDGKLYYEQFVNQTQTRLDISLRNDLYLAVYKTHTEMQTTKLIIN